MAPEPMIPDPRRPESLQELTQRVIEQAGALGAERERRRVDHARRQAEGRVLYSDSHGRPILRPSFVVYVDTLGTKERMRSFDDAQLREYVDGIDHLNAHLHDPGLHYDLQQFIS